MNICDIPACELLLAIYVVGWLISGALIMKLPPVYMPTWFNVLISYLVGAAWPLLGILWMLVGRVS